MGERISSIQIVCHLIILVSVIFVFVYLVKLDLLSISIRSVKITPLFYSLILLLVGYTFAVWNWQVLLSLSGYPITLSQSLYSTGLSIFGKYVPGKIWATIGRAGLVGSFGIPFGQALIAAVHLQVFSTLTGLLLGAVGLTASDRLWSLRIAIWGFAAVLMLLFLVPGLRAALFQILGRLLKRNLHPIPMGTSVFLEILCLCIAQWLSWSFGFYFLVKAFAECHISVFSTALAFPLSVSIGVISVFSPGGLGVREGVIVGALGIAGMSLNDAMSISVMARIWFVVGEASLFFGALLSKRTVKGSGQIKTDT